MKKVILRIMIAALCLLAALPGLAEGEELHLLWDIPFESTPEQVKQQAFDAAGIKLSDEGHAIGIVYLEKAPEDELALFGIPVQYFIVYFSPSGKRIVDIIAGMQSLTPEEDVSVEDTLEKMETLFSRLTEKYGKADWGTISLRDDESKEIIVYPIPESADGQPDYAKILAAFDTAGVSGRTGNVDWAWRNVSLEFSFKRGVFYGAYVGWADSKKSSMPLTLPQEDDTNLNHFWDIPFENTPDNVKKYVHDVGGIDLLEEKPDPDFLCLNKAKEDELSLFGIPGWNFSVTFNPAQKRIQEIWISICPFISKEAASSEAMLEMMDTLFLDLTEKYGKADLGIVSIVDNIEEEPIKKTYYRIPESADGQPVHAKIRAAFETSGDGRTVFVYWAWKNVGLYFRFLKGPFAEIHVKWFDYKVIPPTEPLLELPDEISLPETNTIEN